WISSSVREGTGEDDAGGDDLDGGDPLVQPSVSAETKSVAQTGTAGSRVCTGRPGGYNNERRSRDQGGGAWPEPSTARRAIPRPSDCWARGRPNSGTWLATPGPPTRSLGRRGWSSTSS